MRFYRDDPTKITQVQWYFVGEDGPWLGREYSFGSLQWDKRENIPEPDVGEVYDPQPWKNGKPPYAINPGGLCGSQDQWIHGALSTDPVPPDYPGTQIPVCCANPQEPEIGGNAIGGEATAVNDTFFGVAGNANGGTATAHSILHCSMCMPTTPYQQKCTWSGFTGANAYLNGVYILTQTGSPCVWTLITSNCSLILQGSGTWNAYLQLPAPSVAYAECQTLGLYHCSASVSFPQIHNGISSDVVFCLVQPA